MTASGPGPGGRAYIFLNGDFAAPPDWPARPGPFDLTVGADGGGRHLAALGWPVHALVGDFDSLGPACLADMSEKGAEIFLHPAVKDAIDFELALELVQERGFQEVDVLGALGGRWDMTFGNIFLAVRPDFAALKIRFRHGPWGLFAVRGPAELTVPGRPGDLLSLLPLGEDVTDINLSGCQYPLSRETLAAGRSRGLSNVMTGPSAALSFGSGTLVIMHRAGVLTQEGD
jgi:thiamine pyrophosphokinase